VILVGGPDETEFNRELLSSDAPFVDAGADGSVEDLGALMAACDWVLTPDSLGYHVACAVGTPAVCVRT
jgi:ADP-heptose:LPS heptosyltransferase